MCLTNHTRSYASLYFAFCVDSGDNELLILEAIHMFVVMLDVTFQNVSEVRDLCVIYTAGQLLLAATPQLAFCAAADVQIRSLT